MNWAQRLAACMVLIIAPTPAVFAGDDGATGDPPTFDVGMTVTAASDYMDTGFTNSDHKPSAGITLTPTYGIFYGTIYGANIDYGSSQPWLETKFAVGATPQFGKLSVDFNLTRRIKFDDPLADRWVPYVTATYAVSDTLSSSLGIGYYDYDAPKTADYWEIYAASTYTFPNASYFTGEFYWEPNVDGHGNDYFATYGTVGVPFLEKFEAIATVGYEIYQDNASTPSYLWSQAGLKYALTDKLSLFAGYHTNNLSSSECPLQAYTDCRSAFLAKLTYTVSLSDLFGKKDR